MQTVSDALFRHWCPAQARSAGTSCHRSDRICERCTRQASCVNDLHELEIRSALRQKVGRGELTQTECFTLLAQLETDFANGVHDRVPVSWNDVFATAESLSASYGVETLCRTLDPLHVSLALQCGATEFCTFDVRQSRMAEAAGLTVIS